MGNDKRVIDMNELVKKRIDALGMKMQRPENSGFVDDINADSKGAMELVEGITLKDYIARKGKLSNKETIGIALQTAEGLSTLPRQNCTAVYCFAP